ncbi:MULTISPECIES: M24 family metallopeptidase [Bacillus]|uniref:Xaa-Pro dipeptidase n=2 Tax=Bacillus TaxID=1386 RepID=A0A0M3R9K5_9BACI|nr:MULTISPECIES: aminopeptidase P family protein [Bacillus]ALC81586.1 Xaa-Pro dipeptidase [Bacillus gobiensis]MBP1080624.1 Xaa-Pro aminopeptidase [Bacillus capparidis]MED1094480.1 aminopeptidase P family protein [Bacillus capparidis]
MGKVKKLRSIFNDWNIDGILITSAVNLRYMTGFTGSSGLAVVSKDRAAFITDFRYMDQANEQIDGFEIIEHKGNLTKKAVETMKDMGIKSIGFEQDKMTYGTYAAYLKQYPDANFVPTSQTVEKLRLIKTPEEIKILEEAAKIADEAFSHILTFIKPGISELSVANELEFYMRKLGASESSFDTIVASGARSALPHGVASDKIIEPGDFVTLDYGAYYKGYCSDITRTVSVGKPSDKLKEIYQVVLEAQLHARKHIKPGISGKEADALARSIIAEKGYGEYFGHSTGHGLGMEVHENPALSIKSEWELEKGMVVTVEPGIYLSGLGGVRIEDDIVLTEDGNTSLIHSPKELIIL